MTELHEELTLNGRYVLKKLIGRGSFGEVWLAEDTLMGMDVALKVFMTFDPQNLENFREEFRITFDLHHDNLLVGMSCDVWERRPFLVMEYCPDGSVGDLLKKSQTIDEFTVWRFIRDVAAGLAYLHGHGPEPIIHRDIKPDNILIRLSGSFAITDFGLSKKTRATMRRMSGRMTHSGSIPYMGPELFESQERDVSGAVVNRVSSSPVKATDIWALGVTVYELVTGELPFCGMGGGMLNSGAEIPDLPEEYSDELNKVMQKMLAKATWDRPTAAQLERWAGRALRNEPVFEGDGGDFGDSGNKDRPKSRKGLWFWLASVVVVLVIAAIAFIGPDKQKLLKECELLEQRADAINSEEKGYREALGNYKKILSLVRDNGLSYDTREVVQKEVELEKKIEERVKVYKKEIAEYKNEEENKFVYKIIIKDINRILLLKEDEQLRGELSAYEEKLKQISK